MNKKGLIAVAFVAFAHAGYGQTLSLAEAYHGMELQYPLIQQRALIQRTGDYSIQNIVKGAFPQLSIAGSATYQSDVTEIPISLPGTSIPSISKDQYRIYIEASQPLTDIITIRIQKEVQSATNRVNSDNLETELYKTRERLNTLYFGILLLDEQRAQSAETREDIQTGINKVSAGVQNGTDFRSSLDKLKAEALRIDQRDIELKAARAAYVSMLSQFIGKTLPDTIKLEVPPTLTITTTINRPEIKALESQQAGYDAQARLLNTKALPKFSLFLQGGAGRPGLNLLDDNLKTYYIGGVRLNWSLSSLYTLRREKQILGINKQIVGVQKEVFLFNTNLTLRQQEADIARLQALINSDNQIIELRASVKTAAQAQLQNGVITVNDYLREVLNEEAAREQKSLHQVQLLQNIYSINNTAGN